MYSAVQVAQYIVDRCTKLGMPISNLKLQKILYFAWIDYFKSVHSALFLDNICAWQLGPVVPSVYYEYCSYAGNPIRETHDLTTITLPDQSELNNIIDRYIDIPASKLVDISHAIGKPWNIIYQNGAGLRNTIPYGLIQRLECEA
ncbi:Panacea domain-containing protein [Intestinibacillus massiliensis]|uniref:Panacea domain-containing protein n=1 Tax=Intestinibacillus massiliensis TaxID=1871029 RepID=UPI000B35B854|nr:type II toxin-antitoxin system antitoxin SocA domain-containing protein [Intestinibacillus massiliensis]